jgi:hypothetical protein
LAGLAWTLPILDRVAGTSRQFDADSERLRERNFFGVAHVVDSRDIPFVEFFHGTTLHGLQSRDPRERKWPRSYFHGDGPIGQLFEELSGPRAKQKIGVVGLGIGSLAAYADRGQEITFYEIDPAVERIARDTRYFTFLSDCEKRGARLKIVLGDGRLQIAQCSDRYGLLVLDAFSSDSVPMHLLTREALRLYLEHLEDDGVLAFNVTNGYLRLAPVLAELTADAGLVSFEQMDPGSSTFDEAIKEAKKTGRFNLAWATPAVQKYEFVRTGRLASQWVIAARRTESLGGLAKDSRWKRIPRRPGIEVWSDDYSNLLSAFIWDVPADVQERLTRIIQDEISTKSAP